MENTSITHRVTGTFMAGGSLLSIGTLVDGSDWSPHATRTMEADGIVERLTEAELAELLAEKSEPDEAAAAPVVKKAVAKKATSPAKKPVKPTDE